MDIDNQRINPKKVVVKSGESASFSCHSHTPVSWTFEGNKLWPSNVKFFDHILIITAVYKINEGFYLCQGETNQLALEGLQRTYQRFYAKSFLWLRGKLYVFLID